MPRTTANTTSTSTARTKAKAKVQRESLANEDGAWKPKEKKPRVREYVPCNRCGVRVRIYSLAVHQQGPRCEKRANPQPPKKRVQKKREYKRMNCKYCLTEISARHQRKHLSSCLNRTDIMKAWAERHREMERGEREPDYWKKIACTPVKIGRPHKPNLWSDPPSPPVAKAETQPEKRESVASSPAGSPPAKTGLDELQG